MKKLENIKNAFLIGVCILAALLSAFYPFDEKTAQTMTSVSDLYGQTNEQRLAFFVSNGVEVEGEPCEITEVIIPLEFNAIYAKYEALQKSQGLSLEQYKGRRVYRYTYLVKNKKDSVAELLIADEKIVAAALVSLSQNGNFSKIIS